MITDHNLAEIDALIGQHFQIEEVTYGGSKQPYIVRYRGNLKESDSQAAYGRIENALQPQKLVALLRKEEGRLNLYLLPEMEKKKEPRSSLNLILFILTLLSVLFTGGLYGYEGEMPTGTWPTILALLKSGWPFAVTLLTILGAHEFGHYFCGRRHGVQVTLPYFIPLPLSLFGTMGAFINMRSLRKPARAVRPSHCWTFKRFRRFGNCLNHRAKPIRDQPIAGLRGRQQRAANGRELTALPLDEIPGIRAGAAAASRPIGYRAAALLAALFLYRAAFPLGRVGRHAAPGRLGRLGRLIRDRHQPAASRAARRRAYFLDLVRREDRAANIPIHRGRPGHPGILFQRVVDLGSAADDLRADVRTAFRSGNQTG